MYAYTMSQWMFFFYFYCFFGWCFESAYVSLKSGKFVNRGFMRGPFLPLYGSGAIMMLVVSMPFKEHIVLVYIAGCIGATILEYVTGVCMEALFKVRYWDYTKNRFNFQGHICLGSSLAWGFLTIFMTEYLHKPVERFALSIPPQWLNLIVLILTAVIGADFALSFKAALDLRDVLTRMEKAKEDLAHVQRRLDVIIALANEDVENKREEIKEELFELRLKYRTIIEEHKRLSRIKDFFVREQMKAHPTMSSKRFKEALEELKENLENYRK